MFGIIGGTGLYSIDGLEILETKPVKTPFGEPSAPLTIGKLGTEKVAFLPRHGVHHQIMPSEINYRANIWALKSVGVKKVISVSATGSLQEEIIPGSLALPNQYLDLTKGKRVSSFFGDGIVAHISTAEPVCPCLERHFESAANSVGVKIHTGKTYACVEGPRLGSRAESFFLRSAGCHVVGMTNVPEAFLAREAQLCYCTVAVVTDYDCWMDDPSQHVSVDKIMALYKDALVSVKKSLHALLCNPYKDRLCHCRSALQGAVLTHEEALPLDKKKILDFLRA